ncbi:MULTISPECIES: hypothetical protein [unclassified Streptomyces]|uniref:hypothetical protein n=1 Tax=unclassified Streptomyces TaxID=2593676 RepID=UPI00381B3C8B
MTIGDLTQVLRTPGESPAACDWTAIGRAWNTQFPSDFKSFLSIYGSGTIEGYLHVMAPEIVGGEAGGSMDFVTDDARGTWEVADHPPGLHASQEDILAWGYTTTADFLCWLTSESDPDRWPVLVYSRGLDAWSVTNCGMAEYLRMNFLREFPENPLNGVEIWGNRNPRFLSYGEQERIEKSGGDPWAPPS